MALVPGVVHKAKEEILILKVVIATYVLDMQIFYQKSAKFSSLNPIFDVLLGD